MAGPITHLVLTQKVYERFFSQKDRGAFVVGTSFPDIRYLGVIEREKTHRPRVTLKQVLEAESFEAGVQFHVLVDVVRERFMKAYGMYELFDDNRYTSQ